MMTPTDLARRLQDLRTHLGSTRQELFKTLLGFAKPGEQFGQGTFSDVINGKRIQTRKADDIAKALEAYAHARNIDFNEISRDTPQQTGSQRQGRKVPEELRGAWFLVQYRGKRRTRSDLIANADYRIAVLVYGAD